MALKKTINKEYLEHQTKDNLGRFLRVPFLVGGVGAAFCSLNLYLRYVGQSGPYKDQYLLAWLAFIVLSVVAFVTLTILERQKNFYLVDRAIFSYVLSICLSSSALSALDFHVYSDLTVFGFAILGAAIAYRTNTFNYLLIVAISILTFNLYFFIGLENRITFQPIIFTVSLGTLAGFIANSLEKNRKHLVRLSLELETANKKLREESLIDPLTQLYNRRALTEFLPREIASFRRTGERLCIAMGDLDYFKRVNDEYGHLAGDEVLRSFSKLLINESRTTDVVVRYGGEEFLIIMPHTAMPDALNLIERVRRQLAVAKYDLMNAHLTASFGVTEITREDTQESLLNRADKLLYLAKDQGRNRICTDHGSDNPNKKLVS